MTRYLPATFRVSSPSSTDTPAPCPDVITSNECAPPGRARHGRRAPAAAPRQAQFLFTSILLTFGELRLRLSESIDVKIEYLCVQVRAAGDLDDPLHLEQDVPGAAPGDRAPEHRGHHQPVPAGVRGHRLLSGILLHCFRGLQSGGGKTYGGFDNFLMSVL